LSEPEIKKLNKCIRVTLQRPVSSNGTGNWDTIVIRRVFRGDGTDIRLSCPDFRPNSTYKSPSTLCGGYFPSHRFLIGSRLISAGRWLMECGCPYPRSAERAMPALFEIRHLPQGTTLEFVGSRGNYYEFEDGSRIDVRSSPVWCRRCGDYTDGESIESLDEIDRQLADLVDPQSELYRITHWALSGPNGRFRRHWIDLTNQRRRWRERRVSPPRCLLCGSTDLVSLPERVEIPNPRGSGTVVLSATGHCSTSFNEWFFTCEGERIPRDTRPTYWALPESPR
jgi:hypothetical protein